MKIKVAVLMTSHNRYKKTITCLETLFQSIIDERIYLSVFLVDDGSTDGTRHYVADKFPEVNLISGNGNLYWNRGMRLAWETAVRNQDFDYYLWLNDDMTVYQDMFNILFQDLDSVSSDSIIVGVIKENISEKTIYGGYHKNRLLYPIGVPQECETFNGNIVLIPRQVYKTIGMLDSVYTHWFGDTDYGLRARKAGFKCFVSSNYVGEGEPNLKGSEWANSKNTLIKRIKILHSPKGLPPSEWYVFSKRAYGNKWFFSFVKLYFRLLFPKLWEKIKKNNL